MGKRLPKKTKSLDKIMKDIDEKLDSIVEEVMPEKVKDELKPQTEMVKLVALQNWVLDGEFIHEGDQIDVSSEQADRILTHTSAFRLAD